MNQIGKTPEELFEHDEDYHLDKVRELHKEKKRIERKIQEHRAELDGYDRAKDEDNDPKPVQMVKKLLRLPVTLTKKVLSYPLSLGRKVIDRVR